MDFMNPFENYRKDAKNLYNDFEVAWAEYEYIRQVLKTRIMEMVEADNQYWQEQGFNDNFYANVDIDDNANILITVKPVISTSVIQDISELLGVEGKITVLGEKKHSKMRISFSNTKTITYNEDPEVNV